MDIWPIQLDERLGNFPIPLLDGEADALDLQSAFSNVYDIFGYAFTIDYSRPPDVPLTPPEAIWAEAQIAKFKVAGNQG